MRAFVCVCVFNATELEDNHPLPPAPTPAAKPLLAVFTFLGNGGLARRQLSPSCLVNLKVSTSSPFSPNMVTSQPSAWARSAPYKVRLVAFIPCQPARLGLISGVLALQPPGQAARDPSVGATAAPSPSSSERTSFWDERKQRGREVGREERGTGSGGRD